MYEILIWSSLICVFFVYLVKFWTSKGRPQDVSGIPKPSILQLLLHIFRNRPHFDGVKILRSLQNTYGDTFLIHIKPFSPIVVTSDHKYFTQVLASKEHLDKSYIVGVLKNILGESIGTAEVDTWRHDRKILDKAFGHESHKEYLERLDQMLHQLDDAILERIHAPIDVQEVLHEFILRTTIEALKDPSVSWDPKRTMEYNTSMFEYWDNTILKRTLPFMLNMDVFFKMTPSYRALQKSVKVIRQFGADFVDAHLKATNQQIDTLNIIYQLHQAGVPYERIVDNFLLFIEAAHVTVASTLAYTIFEIAKNPDVQSKIFAEVEATVGKDRNAPISPGDVHNLKYTSSVLKEQLRIQSAVPFVTRKLNKSIVVDNVFLPKDTTVLFSISKLQLSEKHYENPLVFNPDRFAAENKQNLVSNTWAPFALGIRNCIGQTLAMQKMTLVLAKMVRRYQFSPIVPEHELDIRSSFATRSNNGVPVIAKVRAEMM